VIYAFAKDVDLIIGAKDSSGDWDNLKAYITETRELDKKFYVLSGNDSLILPRSEACNRILCCLCLLKLALFEKVVDG